MPASLCNSLPVLPRNSSGEGICWHHAGGKLRQIPPPGHARGRNEKLDGGSGRLRQKRQVVSCSGIRPHSAVTGLLLAAVGLLAACNNAAHPHSRAAAAAAASEQASARLGDVVVRANAVPTAGIGEAVARQYGIARDDGTVMLLVGVRRGPEAGETALPARVTASATDLLGKRQAITMREVRSGEFVDYVGIAQVITPDTLRFDVKVVPEDAPAMTLQFNRDFFP